MTIMALTERGNGEFFRHVRRFYTLKVKQTIEFSNLQDKAEAHCLIILFLLYASSYLLDS